MIPAAAAVEPHRPRAFLGVERSATGRRWRLRSGDDLLGLSLAQRLGLPEVVGRVLAGRGIAPEDAERHLAPTLRDLMPDPSRLTDMDRAVARLARAVSTREKIWVFGDYDVDGATSAALLTRYFRALGLDVASYIPDRRTEGYGPNTPALLKLHADGARLVIAVDCGTMAIEPLEAAAQAGLDLIVLDHHAPGARLPPAVAVVNPNRLDDTSGMGGLCAVGVVFLTLVALNRALRGMPEVERPLPELMEYLDLVALGTVCDVVPLTGLNRALVAQGLRVLAARRNPGLLALADCARVAERPDAYHLGYLLGPRVNAGGRVGKSDLGTRLLATDDPIEAAGLALDLDRLNDERREIEAEVLRLAIAQVEAGPAVGPVIIADGREWHQGVIGIVAGRLKERYNRPACVIAWTDGIGKGSGRSIPGVDLGAAIIAASSAGLLLGGGGHKMAAGFSLAEGRLPELAAFLAARVGRTIAAGNPTPELGVDGILQPGACTPALCATLECLGPFGSGNAEPRFVLPQMRIMRADPVGATGSHVRCILAPGFGPERIKAIAFRADETPIGQLLNDRSGLPIHVAGHLRPDRWQGREEVQFFIDDAAPAVA